MTDEDRTLGPEMKEEGWIVIGGDAMIWLHEPSHRCIDLHPAIREQCEVTCWGAEPSDPKTSGYCVGCSVRDDNGNPLYGDAFWTASYAVAVKIARKIRREILAETPAQRRARKREYDRRCDEAWRQMRNLCAINARLTAAKE